MDAADQALWRALQPLRSVACWLMTGAHPDDEWNGFLAWLRYGSGVRTVYACATRGEGGQNALGPERGRLLGALRSREMELAAREIGLSVRWIGAGPASGFDDPVVDFGFSKSAEDTLRRWGAARLLARLVRVIRAERPDALSPTFLDVPGQHGHHRAVTRMTLEAAELAADPDFLPDLPTWRVAHIYLPAFSGAGGSYDDEMPPPPETMRVDLGAWCAPLVASWAQLGERSRAFHASQGMGRDLPDGPRPFPLHLAAGPSDAAAPLSGVPHSLSDLAGTLPTGVASRALAAAGAAIDEALAGFPERQGIAAALHRALGLLDRLPSCPPDIAARIGQKRRELAAVAAQALGIGADIALAPLRAGEPARLSVTVHGPATAVARLPPGWAAGIPADAAPFGTLRDGFDPLGGSEPAGATLRWTHAGTAAALELDPPAPVALAPAREASVAPRAVVRREESRTPVVLALAGAEPPPAWPVVARGPAGLEIAPVPGRLDLPAAGARLARLGAVAIVEPATAAILRASVAIDGAARVGVIAGEADETLGWLRQLDIAAEPVDPAAPGALSGFDVLLIGVFAFGQVPALSARRDAIAAWTRSGGSLVTLYHRPGDGWDGGRTPPLPLRIGAPSIRWRVSDPAAPVRVLAPDHRLLAWPNRMAETDWDGWVRERGLYFAAEWDPAYVPLLSMSDPGEVPLRGALLAAPVGSGRHVHVALALHHQLSALVPGAFRLLANLVARATP
jgi:LmbE family N-acetylglucosaminyl deacetylase